MEMDGRVFVLTRYFDEKQNKHRNEKNALSERILRTLLFLYQIRMIVSQ